jgi:hypothetical protein
MARPREDTACHMPPAPPSPHACARPVSLAEALRARCAAGQVVLSSNSSDSNTERCPTLFGTAAEGSGPPPYGRGTLHLYDSDQESYNVTYSPSSFVVKVQNCTFTFKGPELNSKSGGGLRKIALTKPGDSESCPSPENPCGKGFWVANSSGVLVAMDTAETPCPAYFFLIKPGSDDTMGQFGLVAWALGGMMQWKPEGSNLDLITGYYENKDIYSTVWIADESTGCTQVYEVDNSTLALGSFSQGAIDPGSASVDFLSAVPSSCPSDCVKGGYNAFWDASGAPPNHGVH